MQVWHKMRNEVYAQTNTIGGLTRQLIMCRPQRAASCGLHVCPKQVLLGWGSYLLPGWTRPAAQTACLHPHLWAGVRVQAKLAEASAQVGVLLRVFPAIAAKAARSRAQ